MIAPPPMSYDRATGRLQGATAVERCAALAFAAGARASAAMHHRGFSIGCRMITSLIDQREIVVMLGDDARFAFPFGDGYWDLLLDRGFTYEGEIERFLRSVADVDYGFIDGGANFGFWSVLASSRPFGSHPVIAIEASSVQRRQAPSATRELNGARFNILHRAIGSTTGNTVWLGGAKHEAFRVEGGQWRRRAKACRDDSRSIACSIRGWCRRGQRLVIKLDVEGMEIEAAKGGKRLLANDNRHHRARIMAPTAPHTVSRYLLDRGRLPLFVFDPGERALRSR